MNNPLDSLGVPERSMYTFTCKPSMSSAKSTHGHVLLCDGSPVFESTSEADVMSVMSRVSLAFALEATRVELTPGGMIRVFTGSHFVGTY